MNAAKRLELFKCLSTSTPNPTTELHYKGSLELLIAVILSAQATDKSVNLATAKLFAVANTAQAIFDLGTVGLESYIKTIGLYRTKARNVIATCKQLIDFHNGEVPNTREALEKLAGVGRKTANVVLNTAFGKSTIAVDTHLFRLGNRTGLARGKTPLEVENKLMRAVPKAYLKDAHHLLILHGRYVCIARTPKCSECVIRHVCEYKEKI